jgi:DNA polymerase sigma
MLIAFLQKEGVLPCLQLLGYDEKKKECQRYIKYHKYTFLSKVFKSCTEHEANIYFANDLEYICRNFKGEENPQTAGELLQGFFHFYSHRFDPSRHAISISHQHPFLYKSDLKQELEKIIKDEAIKAKMLKGLK